MYEVIGPQNKSWRVKWVCNPKLVLCDTKSFGQSFIFAALVTARNQNMTSNLLQFKNDFLVHFWSDWGIKVHKNRVLPRTCDAPDTNYLSKFVRSWKNVELLFIVIYLIFIYCDLLDFFLLWFIWFLFDLFTYCDFYFIFIEIFIEFIYWLI